MLKRKFFLLCFIGLCLGFTNPVNTFAATSLSQYRIQITSNVPNPSYLIDPDPGKQADGSYLFNEGDKFTVTGHTWSVLDENGCGTYFLFQGIDGDSSLESKSFVVSSDLVIALEWMPMGVPCSTPTPPLSIIYQEGPKNAVSSGSLFQTQIYCKLISHKIAAYGLTLSYDPLIIQPDESVGMNGVVGGAFGLSAVNSKPGELSIAAFNTSGLGPGELHLLTVNWIAVATSGSTTIDLALKDIADPDSNPIFLMTQGPVEISVNTYALGDANRDGQIDIIDALLVAQYYVGWAEISHHEADVDGDGNTTIVDALLIAQFYVGLIDEF